MRILIVEDEPRLAEALAQLLQQNKYSTDVVHTGTEGYDYAASAIYDAVVLDVMLPGLNGFEVVSRMRKNKISTPVLLLTAKDEIMEKILGLDSGADDYLTKPFSTDELLARLRALTRRQGEVVLDEIRFSDLSLNCSALTLQSGMKSVRLGMKEFELMRMLISCPQTVLPKEQILIKLWGTESDAEDNNVEVYISFLRKKLSFLNSDVSIETVRKLGYYLKEKSV